MATLDPIQFELFRNALFSIPNEMALTVHRTTHSAVAKDNKDDSTAFCGAEEPVEFATLRAIGTGMPERARLPDHLSLDAIVSTQRARPAPFGRAFAWRSTAVLARSALGRPRPRPRTIEKYDCTCPVTLDMTTSLDGFGNIVTAIEGEPSA